MASSSHYPSNRLTNRRPHLNTQISFHDDEDEADFVDASLPSTPFPEDDDEGEHRLFDKANVKEEREEVQDGNGDDSQCRICFGGVEDEEMLGRLISPCLCTGSMRVSFRSVSKVMGSRLTRDSMFMVSLYCLCAMATM